MAKGERRDSDLPVNHLRYAARSSYSLVRITIARIYGIPVRIDYRWFAVVALSVWLIAGNLQSHAIQLGNVRLPPVAPLTAWILGFITTAGLVSFSLWS